MLGFSILISLADDELIDGKYLDLKDRVFTAWKADVGEIDWILKLHEENRCKLIKEKHFYPNIYEIPCKEIRDWLSKNSPQKALSSRIMIENENIEINDDYDPPLTFRNLALFRSLNPETLLHITVWDLS
ncbi:hypothetical protein H0G77_03485 [[Pasteurella] aerogenes]|nr:hypothetical protein [[Pasteurella] aerogenes]MDY2947009.1 hypothetical protein [Mannheimia varigena]